MPVKITTQIAARGYELDSYGHINNAVYLNYFEHARWDYFRQTGLSTALNHGGIVAVVTEINIRYQHEVLIFDDLRVESVCSDEGPWMIFRQRMFNATRQNQAARATTKLVFIDREKKPQDIPAEVLAVIRRSE